VEELGAARLLPLVSYRPESEHRWGTMSDYSLLSLEALEPERTTEFNGLSPSPD